MQPDQRDAAYLWDMLDAARTLRQICADLDWSKYAADRKTQLASERLLEIIGEAAGKVSVPFREAHPQIPWRQIIGQRNVLIHEYGEIKQERVWKVVAQDIPILIQQLEALA
ncbi:MAG: DUF86 domain-containing protein [Phycisphaerae bacterium]|nr:DUF86 domain-containing protein [Phycisphaerae bacterium]